VEHDSNPKDISVSKLVFTTVVFFWEDLRPFRVFGIFHRSTLSVNFFYGFTHRHYRPLSLRFLIQDILVVFVSDYSNGSTAQMGKPRLSVDDNNPNLSLWNRNPVICSGGGGGGLGYLVLRSCCSFARGPFLWITPKGKTALLSFNQNRGRVKFSNFTPLFPADLLGR